MNYLKLQNKNIESLLEALKSLEINLEFGDPEKLRQFSEILSKRYFFNYLEDLNRRATRVILFEIDVEKKETISCGAYLHSQYSMVYPEYQRFVRKNLNTLRKLLRTYSILDVDGLSLITWKGSTHFEDENLEGFSYFLPYRPLGDENYGKSVIDRDNIKNFYLTCGIESAIANYFVDKIDENVFLPHYATFSVDSDFPVKYGVTCCVDDTLFELIGKFYSKYESIDVLQNFLLKYFNKSFASIQLSSVNHQSFSIEVGVNRSYFEEIFNEILKDEQYLHLCGINIEDLNIPQFVTTVILKFKWEDQYNKKMKIYMETDDEQVLDGILL